MRKNFEYLYTVRAEDSIEIEDIGNCCIKVFNDIGYYWYLIIETSLGDSYIKIFGPFNTDIKNYFIHGFNFNFSKIDYTERKLEKIIDNFINDPKKMVSQVVEITSEEAYNELLNIDFKEMR